MTLTELDARMTTAVSRPDIANSSGSYVQFFNDAQREICRRRSWGWMKAEAVLPMASSATSVTLPTRFKELTSTRTPVYVRLSNGTDYPVDIWTKEKHKRRAATRVGSQVVAHLDDTPVPPVLEFLASLGEDADVVVDHYLYPEDLSLTNPSNPLTVQHPELLLSLAKARAFLTINDPAGADHLTIYEQLFRQAASSDGYAQIAGTTLRM